MVSARIGNPLKVLFQQILYVIGLQFIFNIVFIAPEFVALGLNKTKN
jgi:hypothetical protein